MTKTTKYPNKVFLRAWDQAEYLDGAQMQFCVSKGGEFDVVAYVDDLKSAKLFCEVLANEKAVRAALRALTVKPADALRTE